MEPVEVLTRRARPIKRAEFDQMGHIFSGERVELIRGWVVEMSPMGTPHQWVCTKLNRMLVEAIGVGAEVRAQLPFAASDDSEPEPDFAIVKEIVPDRTPSTALLIIEASDTTLRFDQGIKADLYAESLVPEYWVVDVNARVVEVRSQPRQGNYGRLETCGLDSKIRLIALPDVELEVSRFLPPGS